MREESRGAQRVAVRSGRQPLLLHLFVDRFAGRAHRKLLGVAPGSPQFAAERTHRLTAECRFHDLVFWHVV